ncbi:MAG: MATE family efflux transporter, partial [Cetobacterium sp.]
MFKILKRYNEDKDFYKKLTKITIPIVLQNFIASSINMLDTLMIGSLGEVELASVGIANQFYFIFSLAIFGISAGCGVFIAQLWGKKDDKNIKKVLGLGLISGAIIALLFTLAAIFMPEHIMGIFNKETQVISKGSSYLIIVAISYILTMITFNYAAALRSIGNPLLPMWASFGALLINGFLNYTFIFGHFGFEAMGVKGAALATVIARMVEMLIILVGVKISVKTLQGKWKDFIGAGKSLKNGVFKTSCPIVLNDLCWGLGNATYAIVFGRIGTGATAAVQIDTTILNFFMIVIYGLANAAVVIVGNEIGAGREKRGITYAGRISRLSIEIGIILAILLASTA